MAAAACRRVIVADQFGLRDRGRHAEIGREGRVEAHPNRNRVSGASTLGFMPRTGGQEGIDPRAELLSRREQEAHFAAHAATGARSGVPSVVPAFAYLQALRPAGQLRTPWRIVVTRTTLTPLLLRNHLARDIGAKKRAALHLFVHIGEPTTNHKEGQSIAAMQRPRERFGLDYSGWSMRRIRASSS